MDRACASGAQGRGFESLRARQFPFRRIPAIDVDMYAQMCIYLPVGYEWDPAKARANFEKHGIHFADAATTLEDDFALTVRDPFSVDEERWITLGKDAAGRLLVVVYTWRGDHARLISARLATPREKSQYEEHHEA
jgi:uncharacterized DUF497 family protein